MFNFDTDGAAKTRETALLHRRAKCDETSSLSLFSALKVQVFHLAEEKLINIFIARVNDEGVDPDQKWGNSKGKNLSQVCSRSDPGQLGECSTKLGQLFILSCNLKLQYVLYPSPQIK